MFCPSCGVKNEGDPLKCFVCGHILPGDRAAREPRRRRAPTLSASEPFAAIGDRMLALILDRIVILSILAIPAASLAEHWTQIDSRLTAPVRAGILAGIAFLIAVLIYHIVLESTFGATLGKGLLGLEVRSESYDSRLLAMTIRNVTRLLDAIVFYALGFLVAAFSSRRQRLGDYLGGTTVVEYRVTTGARIALLFIFAVVVGGALWLAGWLCPSCLPDRSRFAF